MGHLAVNRIDDSESINVLLAALWRMTGDRDVSLPVLTTTPQQEIVQENFNMSHVVVIWLSLLVFVEQFFFGWCHRTDVVERAKHGCSVGTQTEPQNFTCSSNAATLTSDGADHMKTV